MRAGWRLPSESSFVRLRGVGRGGAYLFEFFVGLAPNFMFLVWCLRNRIRHHNLSTVCTMTDVLGAPSVGFVSCYVRSKVR